MGLAEVVERLVRGHRVVLFAREGAGGRACVVTARLARLLVRRGVAFTTGVDDPELRAAVEEHSAWPSFPLVYLDGEIIGGLNAVEELAAAGDLP